MGQARVQARRVRALAVGGCAAFALLAGAAGAAAPAFVEATGSPLPAVGPHSEATADLNRDGKLDLAVANANGTTISIFLGDGAGGFGSPAPVSVGNGPSSIAGGDVNRDKKLDCGLWRLEPSLHPASMSGVCEGNALTVGKIGVRQVFAHNHNAIPPGPQPLQRRFVHAQSVPVKVGRRVENILHVAEAEGLPAPRGELAR